MNAYKILTELAYCKMSIQKSQVIILNNTNNKPFIYCRKSRLPCSKAPSQKHKLPGYPGAIFWMRLKNTSVSSGNADNLPRALNLVKKVGDLRLTSGPSTRSRKKGTVPVWDHTVENNVFDEFVSFISSLPRLYQSLVRYRSKSKVDLFLKPSVGGFGQ